MKPFNVIVLLLSAIALGAVVWWNWTVFERVGGEMPAAGWIALGLGVVFSLVVGVTLMVLVFVSSRRGYDERVGMAEIDTDPPTETPRAE